MTGKEFSAWLDGYLDGKQKLGPRQIEKIREKAEGIYDSSPTYWWHTTPSYPGTADTWTIPCTTTTTIANDYVGPASSATKYITVKANDLTGYTDTIVQ